MLKQFSLIITVIFALTFLSQTSTNAYSFPDVKDHEELVHAVDYLSNAGIINGYSDGTYRPNVAITRAQAAKIIAGALAIILTNPPTVNFVDVPQTDFYYPYIAALASIGIFDSGASHFRPNDSMTRAEMAKVLTLSFDFYHEVSMPFTDTVNHWSELFVSQLYATKVTKGVSNSLFGVGQNVTRGQLALFIVRAQDYVELSRETVTAESLGYNEINGSIYHLIGYPNAVAVQAYDHYVLFDAVEEGSAFGWVENAAFESELIATKATFYQFDVVEENGKLILNMTELEVQPYQPVIVSIFDSLKHYELYYLDGSPVEEFNVDLQLEYDHYFDLYIYDDYGEYILRYTNEAGQTFQLLVSVIDGLVSPEVYTYDYVTSGINILTETILEVFDVDVGTIQNVMAINEDGDPITEDLLALSFGENFISLRPNSDVYFELLIEGSKNDIWMMIWFEQFGEGYTMSWE